MNFKIMGIVNVTPDSFSDGGQFEGVDEVIAHSLKLVSEGAHILDIGGESTRPGAAEVSIEEELERVIPVIERLAGETDALLSVDTRKPAVASAAVAAGADIWNDVSALTFAKDSLTTAAALGVPVILMHAQGRPETMQEAPTYGSVAREVQAFLLERADAAMAAGVAKEHITLDPGIGFGKTLEHNVSLFQNLAAMTELGYPILLGASRKRFIEEIDQISATNQRLGGSLAAVLHGAAAGVQLFRVHDVAETRQALAVWAAMQH